MSACAAILTGSFKFILKWSRLDCDCMSMTIIHLKLLISFLLLSDLFPDVSRIVEFMKHDYVIIQFEISIWSKREK